MKNASRESLAASGELRRARLRIAECQGFFEIYLAGLLQTGLIHVLQSFSSPNHRLDQAIRSWAKALCEGLSYRESLEIMSPQFPAGIEALLGLGSDKSILDQAVSEILQVYSANPTEESRLEALTRLLNQYLAMPSNGIICEGCFEAHFLKLFARYALEQAHEVILEQEADAYFHQKYVGTKLVQISEPCHAMVFESIQTKLQLSAPEGKLTLAGVNQSYALEQINPQQYKLTGHQQTVVIRFQV